MERQTRNRVEGRRTVPQRQPSSKRDPWATSINGTRPVTRDSAGTGGWNDTSFERTATIAWSVAQGHIAVIAASSQHGVESMIAPGQAGFSHIGEKRMTHRLFSIVGAAVLMIGGAHFTGRCVRIADNADDRGRRAATGKTETASQVSLDEELVSDFRRRADRYMELHEKLQKQGTRQKQRDDVGENLVSEQALAMRIRFARHDARPGDLFTPPIAMAIRRALDPELRGFAALSARQSIREDAPATFVLVVNGDYPVRSVPVNHAGERAEDPATTPDWPRVPHRRRASCPDGPGCKHRRRLRARRHVQDLLIISSEANAWVLDHLPADPQCAFEVRTAGDAQFLAALSRALAVRPSRADIAFGSRPLQPR